jgi:carbamate kinase
MTRTVVVALGGNAITRSGQTGTYAEQRENALAMARMIHHLHCCGWAVALVHGNGPQIGTLAVQQEEGASRFPQLPLFLLDAMTEGSLGSLLTLALREVGGPDVPGAVAVVTHVVVDPDDPAFANPTKPIGLFLTAAEARRLAAERGWVVGEDAGRGFRRLVPSPRPLQIVELDAVRALVHQGMIVIAAGGGGIPVVVDGSGYRGIDAVIDKDLAAQRVASALGAEALVLVTDVARVMLDFGTERARAIPEMTVEEAQAHADAGQFASGSMGPKVTAAIEFLREGGRTAVITNAERVGASLDPGAGSAVSGTRIVVAGHGLGVGAAS